MNEEGKKIEEEVKQQISEAEGKLKKEDEILMDMEQNLQKAKEFIDTATTKIPLTNGEKKEFTVKLGMGRAMDALSHLVEMLKIIGLKFEDLFPKEGEDTNEEKEQQAFFDILNKGVTEKGFREHANRMVEIILKEKEGFAYEMVEWFDGLWVIQAFFLRNLGMIQTLTNLKTKNQMQELQEELDSEKSSPGVLPKEGLSSQNLTNS